MSTNTKTILWVVVLIIIIGGGYMLYNSNREPADTSPIKIGFIGPLTGDGSSIGTVNRVAVEIAAEEINQKGGVEGRKLEVVYEDGRCDSTTATKAANKLINIDKVSAIVGGLCSSETSAFGPAAMDSKVIVFSYGSSAPSLSKLGKYFFRSYPSDSFQGIFAAEYAYNTLRARKVAILYHNNDWGTGIKDVFIKRFKELGGEILVEEGAPQTVKDYRTQLAKIKDVKADVIYAPLYPDGSIVALTQAQNLGISTVFLGGDAWGDPKMQQAVSGRGTLYFVEADMLLTDEFKAKILARSGGDQVPLGTANAYDNVYIIASAIAKAGTDPDMLANTIRATRYTGISGNIEFDENGDLKTASYVVKKIENGSAVVVK